MRRKMMEWPVRMIALKVMDYDLSRQRDVGKMIRSSSAASRTASASKPVLHILLFPVEEKPRGNTVSPVEPGVGIFTPLRYSSTT